MQQPHKISISFSGGSVGSLLNTPLVPDYITQHVRQQIIAALTEAGYGFMPINTGPNTTGTVTVLVPILPEKPSTMVGGTTNTVSAERARDGFQPVPQMFQQKEDIYRPATQRATDHQIAQRGDSPPDFPQPLKPMVPVTFADGKTSVPIVEQSFGRIPEPQNPMTAREPDLDYERRLKAKNASTPLTSDDVPF